jgi:tetratricopeptide (TPR) repeat protein
MAKWGWLLIGALAAAAPAPLARAQSPGQPRLLPGGDSEGNEPESFELPPASRLTSPEARPQQKWTRPPISGAARPRPLPAPSMTPAPAVQRAGSLGSVAPHVSLETSDPEARPLAAQSTSAGDGNAMVAHAYEMSLQAKTEEAYTETIELCRSGLHAGVAGARAAYARRLMAWSHNRRGELRATAGQDDAAFEDFDAAVDLDGNAWRAVHNRGVSYAGQGKTAEALADFTRTIELNSEYGLAYFNRGEMRYDLGEFEAALDDYDTAARVLPDDAGILNSRGHAHYKLTHYKQAVADFNATLRLDPGSAAAYVNRGDVYADMGFFAEAAKDYQSAIRIRPEMGRAYQSAAWLMATCPKEKFRDANESVKAAQKALELDGEDDYRYVATLAAALASAGRFDVAERAQRAAVEGAPAELRPIQQQRLALYHSHKPFRTTLPESQSRLSGQIRNAPRR